MVYLSQGCGLVQGVASDGQEDVEQRVVSAQGQHHKVHGVHQPSVKPTTLKKINFSKKVILHGPF